MAPITATAIIFKDFVNEGRVPEDNFVEKAQEVDSDALKDGEVLVELLYLSVDPYMRGRMINQKGYFSGSFVPGQPLESGGVGIIRASKSQHFKEAEVVTGLMPWCTHFVLDEAKQEGLTKIDPAVLGKVPLSYFLGTLGMPGMTAYVGLKKIAQPKKGEVALVSAAAGAVGLVVGQLLKNVYGCRVIGSAGSDDKVKLLDQVGFDYTFNYKTHSKLEALDEAAPDGIDIYWENVGGAVLAKVLDIAKNHARIVACGMVSQYDLPNDQKYGVKNLFQVVTKRIKMEGMIVGDYYSDKELMHEFQTDMARYVQEGQVKVFEHVTEGIANAGRAFTEMMRGANEGKAVVKVVNEDPFPAQQQS